MALPGAAMPPAQEARVRPFLVRPGARYRCFGDGLCCTDIHILGPLTKTEAKRVAKVDPEGLAYDDGPKLPPVLRIATDGTQCYAVVGSQVLSGEC